MPKKRVRRTKKKSKRNPSKKSMAYRLCSCIKSVRRRKNQPRMTRKQAERRAIAICVHSVVKRKGKRLHSFTCKKSLGRPSVVLDK